MSATSRRARYREQRENARRTILAAAAAFLRERPYRELSVDALMSEAGLARTLFYRHFGELTELVLCLLEDIMSELQTVAERWSDDAGVGFPQPAVTGLTATVEFFRRHGPLLRAIADAAATDERIEAGVRRVRRGFEDTTAATLERLVAEGRLDVPDPRAMARALNLMNNAYLLEEFGHGAGGDPELVLATLETIWLRALGPRISPSPAVAPVSAR